jgi:hypothetical protein
MDVEFVRYALDRAPISLIIDDATVLLNLNYFWMRDRNLVDGQGRRWEDVPVVHPESFTREWAAWCLEHGVRGKFSVVPCPAALGRIDHGLPLFGKAQQESWLAMCRELIAPSFDITPEMLTHTVVVDPHTLLPLEPSLWEQYEWATLPVDQEELLVDYVASACRILDNVGLTPQGVTSPGGFGGNTLALYARAVGEGVRRVTGDPVPFFFQRVSDGAVELPVWYADPVTGTAVGEIIAGTGDWTGNWTGYGEVNVDRYITADLEGGRLPALIRAHEPAVLCSHWQGFYGLHDDDRRGFRALKTIVQRLKALDPQGEITRWRTCSEITRYACARSLAALLVSDSSAMIELPFAVPEVTLRLRGVRAAEVWVQGRPLARAGTRAGFGSGAFLVEENGTLLAFDAERGRTEIGWAAAV